MGARGSKENVFKADYSNFTLTTPTSEMTAVYDVIVIGSGYGGSIAASRCARAGQNVCLLERGKEWIPGEFPETEVSALGEVQISTVGKERYGDPTNLYDLIVGADVAVLQGCGLGGTSLINANVALKPEDAIFRDTVWPKELRDDVENLLNMDLPRFESMINPQVYPDSFPQLPKMDAMKEAGKYIALDIEDLPVDVIFKKTPLYVSFEDTKANKFGVPQPKCIGCGNCCGGCNTGAKSTLNMNYIPDAKAHGAHIFTKISVKAVIKNDTDENWMVHYINHDMDNAGEHTVSAKVVILGAGSLGSTNILLESKRRGLELGDAIGQKFSTNGDHTGFSFNGEKAIRPVGVTVSAANKYRNGPGPCITSFLDMRSVPGKDRRLQDSYVIQDGTPPLSVDVPYKAMMYIESLNSGQDTTPNEDELKEFARALSGKAFDNTIAFLAMSNDTAAGVMTLDNISGRVNIHWPGIGEGENFEKISDGMKMAATALKGEFIPNPYWKGIVASLKDTKGIITVHPLGGCPMGESGETGAVNQAGLVFSGNGKNIHDGLLVVDGSIIPRSVGVNPTVTIAALAERCMRLLAERKQWVINYDEYKPINLEK